VVQKGQYLLLIARRYRTTVMTLRRMNKLARGSSIYPGQKLRVPAETPSQRPEPEREAQRGAKSLHKGIVLTAGRDATRRAEERAGADTKEAKENDDRRGAGRAERKGKPSGRRHDPTPSEAAGATDRDQPVARRKSSLADTYQRKPARPGHVAIVRHHERYLGPVVDERGRLLPKAAARLERMLRSRTSGKQHPIHPRLVRLLASVSDHFGGRTILVVSGFRPYSPKQFTQNSRHNHGAAIDFRIAGVPPEAIFDFCRRLNSVGCGLYPNSKFVHLDVRSRKTEWTDYSRSGEAPRYAHLMRRTAARAAAREAPATPPPSKNDVAPPDDAPAAPTASDEPAANATPPADE
jgi:uncharacterized protein YcbK (DUF882 family)/LysM repeat protein